MSLSLSSESIPSQSDMTSSIVDGINIPITVFGKVVTIQGQAAEMNISTFSKFHRGNYTLTIKNYENLVSSIIVVIFPSGPPESPTLFTTISVTSFTIVLHWEKRFNGGHKQTFVISVTEREAIKNIVFSKETEEKDSVSDYTMTVRNLKPDTEYNITLRAYNQVGRSSSQYILTSTIKEAVSTAVFPWKAAGVSSALILVIILAAILLKRRLTKDTSKDGDLMNARYAVSHDDDPEDGMKPNIIYESAGPYFAAHSDNLVENNDFDDIVDVSASDKKGNAIYAVVNKAKKSTKNSGAACCAETDDNYENLEGGINKVGEKCTVGLIENKRSRRKNKEGLVYVEVVVDNSDQSGGVIHGIENRNDYVDIDFSRRADPLPSDDEEDVAPCEPQKWLN